MRRLYREAGRQLLFRMRPPGSRRFDETGRCSVCGATVRFRHNAWLIPSEMRRALADERLVRAFARRESMVCPSCLASLRVRRMADTLLSLYSRGAMSLGDLVEEEEFCSLRIAEINAIGAAHHVLARHPQLEYSEYHPSPEALDGVRNENIESLSYPDAAFDLVLTSDTLEHVPRPIEAIRETRRVLKSGGRHVFTVPLVPSEPRSVTRATLGPDGSVEHRLSPVHHGRGSGPFRLAGRRTDYLVFTDFGRELVDTLSTEGFSTILDGYEPDAPTHEVDLVIVATAEADRKGSRGAAGRPEGSGSLSE